MEFQATSSKQAAWRGGATIFMRAVLKAYGVTDRYVWVADSFEGLPPPETGKYPHDAGDRLHEARELAVSLEEVKANFERYGLLDDQVRFLKGWFRDTLPAAPIERLAVLRLDGDMYESTMDTLVNLYPKLSEGGYAIVDDYGAIPACRQAVNDYRSANAITEKIRNSIDRHFLAEGHLAINMTNMGSPKIMALPNKERPFPFPPLYSRQTPS